MFETLGDEGWEDWWDHYFDRFSSSECEGMGLPCSPNLSKGEGERDCVSREESRKVYEAGQWEYDYIFGEAQGSREMVRLSFGEQLNLSMNSV
jgi:2-phosphoxylose phosphatase